MPPDIIVWAGFRTHILLPHDVVGSLIDDKPTWSGLEVQASKGVDLYLRHDKPVLSVRKARTRVSVIALAELWVQEPGLVVKLAGEGTWRGYGPTGQWTSPAYGLEQKDAHVSTVHFPRSKSNPFYTVGVEYSGEGVRWRFRSDGGFTDLLKRPAEPVPWQECQVFGEAHTLAGTYPDKSERSLRRWELAGKPPNVGQMYFVGWTGGPGAVVNARGRTPVPGAGEDKASYNLLYDPRSWRRLGKGQSISQTLTRKTLA